VNRIEQIFADLRSQNKRALMPFVCGGHPKPDSLRTLLPALEAAGASIVEIGIPFSDPIADGPIIAAAMHEAIAQGVTPRSVFEDVAAIRANTAQPVNLGLIAMCSVSIVHRMGGSNGFAQAAKQAGFDGLIIPDAPLEESRSILEAAAKHELTATLLISPTTPLRRAEEIVKASTGFVYLVARSGITGERTDAPEIGSRVNKLRELSSLPIAVGFGVSTADHVRAVVRDADAAIVGSALVRRISVAHVEGRDAVAEATAFCRELATGLA